MQVQSVLVVCSEILTCKGENCHLRAGAQEVPDLLDIVSAAGDDVDHTWGDTSLMNEGSQGQSGQGSVLSRLHNTRAA